MRTSLLISLLLTVALNPSDAVAGRGASLPAALRASPNRQLNPSMLREVEAKCPDGRAGWRDVSPDGAKPWLSALRSFPWKERGYQEPQWGCAIELALMCGPDLDGAGEPELLVRLRWGQPPEAEQKCADVPLDELQPREAILIATGSLKGRRRVLDLVTFSAASQKAQMPEQRLAFVRMPDRKLAVRIKTQASSERSGCEVLSFWVGRLQGERFSKVAEADPEFCLPD